MDSEGSKCEGFLVVQGDIKLPASKTMWADVRRSKAIHEAWFKASTRRYLLVEYISFMDELSRMIGCTPPNFRQFIYIYIYYTKYNKGNTNISDERNKVH